MFGVSIGNIVNTFPWLFSSGETNEIETLHFSHSTAWASGCTSLGLLPLSESYISFYSESSWSLNIFRAGYLHIQRSLADPGFYYFFPLGDSYFTICQSFSNPCPITLKRLANFNEIWQKSRNLKHIKFLPSLCKSIGEEKDFEQALLFLLFHWRFFFSHIPSSSEQDLRAALGLKVH